MKKGMFIGTIVVAAAFSQMAGAQMLYNSPSASSNGFLGGYPQPQQQNTNPWVTPQNGNTANNTLGAGNLPNTNKTNNPWVTPSSTTGDVAPVNNLSSSETATQIATYQQQLISAQKNLTADNQQLQDCLSRGDNQCAETTRNKMAADMTTIKDAQNNLGRLRDKKGDVVNTKKVSGQQIPLQMSGTVYSPPRGKIENVPLGYRGGSEKGGIDFLH